VESIPQPIPAAGWGERLASNVLFWLWLSMASLVPLLELVSPEQPGIARPQPAETPGPARINVELP